MSIPKSHYFEARPATASRPRTVRLRLGALELALQADRGVFGSKGIDAGTMILVGKAPLHDLLLTWLPRLKPGGAAYLVVQRNLGSDSLAKWLGEQGFDVTR